MRRGHPELRTLFRYFEGLVSGKEEAFLRTHIQDCSNCTNILQRFAETEKMAQSFKTVTPKLNNEKAFLQEAHDLLVERGQRIGERETKTNDQTLKVKNKNIRRSELLQLMKEKMFPDLSWGQKLSWTTGALAVLLLLVLPISYWSRPRPLVLEVTAQQTVEYFNEGENVYEDFPF